MAEFRLIARRTRIADRLPVGFAIVLYSGAVSAPTARSHTPAPVPLVHALSVDVEEHFQVEAFAAQISPSDWLSHPSRVVANTERVLELFARHQTRATFFIVGWVAEGNPALVRTIVASGHEIGCHSHMHQAIWKLTPEQFRADLHRSLSAIQDAAGSKVEGFRAPTFSITRKTLWALDILAEAGLRYDSSIFPVVHDNYGIPEAPRTVFQWDHDGRSLYEMPMTTVQLAGRNLPAAGGGYMRLLPLAYNRWAIRRTQRAGRPAIVYFHPWEVDPEQPRIAAGWKSRLRHYTNLAKMKSRLDSLLSEFRFAPMREVLEHEIVAGRVTASNIIPVLS